MNILLIRMMGLGDVACIGIPAARILRKRHPDARISFLTYAAGGELAALVPEIDQVITVSPDEWPEDIFLAMESFTSLGQRLVTQCYDQIVNLDTWFMPCLLGQVLRDIDQPLVGNHLSMSIHELLDRLVSQTLTTEYVDTPGQYIHSTFPNMGAWFTPWWEQHTDTDYPHFYLNHCCGFEDRIEISLAHEPDTEILAAAAGRKIIAIEWAGRAASKQYPYGEQLKARLEDSGYYVWRQFDGTVSMKKTLSRLAASDLLITVPTAVQWLARLSGCPALVIPGPLPPGVLGAEAAIAKTEDCQYCYQKTCVTNRDFACMSIPVSTVVKAAEKFFQQRPEA